MHHLKLSPLQILLPSLWETKFKLNTLLDHYHLKTVIWRKLETLVQFTKCQGPPSNLFVEILTYNVTVLEGETFGRKLDHKNRALLNGIRILTRVQRVLPCKYTMWSRQSANQKRTFIRTSHAGIFTLNFLPPQLW
jgi:hypothetical protein